MRLCTCLLLSTPNMTENILLTLVPTNNVGHPHREEEERPGDEARGEAWLALLLPSASARRRNGNISICSPGWKKGKELESKSKRERRRS